MRAADAVAATALTATAPASAAAMTSRAGCALTVGLPAAGPVNTSDRGGLWKPPPRVSSGPPTHSSRPRPRAMTRLDRCQPDWLMHRDEALELSEAYGRRRFLPRTSGGAGRSLVQTAQRV